MRDCALQTFLGIGLLLFASVAYGADDPSKKQNASTNGQPSFQDLEKGLSPDPVTGSGSTDDSKAKPTLPPCDNINDSPTKGSCWEAHKAYYEYQKAGLEHRKSAFTWQLWTSRITFFTVILLVLSGLYFSGIQFHSSLRASKAATAFKKVKDELDIQKSGRKAGAKGEVEGKTSVKESLKTPVEGMVNDEKTDIEVIGKLTDNSERADYLVTQIEASPQGFRISSPILGVIILALSFLFFYLYLKYIYPIMEIF